MRQESQPADLLGAGPQSAVLALALIGGDGRPALRRQPGESMTLPKASRTVPSDGLEILGGLYYTLERSQ